MPLNPEEPMRSLLASEITEAVKNLLTSKHLYQSVELQAAFLKDSAELAGKSARAEATRGASGINFSGTGPKQYIADAERIAIQKTRQLNQKTLSLPWQTKPLENDPPSPIHGNSGFYFELPTIQAFCPSCQARWPCNPGTNATWGSLRPAVYTLTSFRGGFSSATEPEQSSVTGLQVGELLAAMGAQVPDTRQLFLFPYQCQQCKGPPISFLVRRTGLKLTLCGRDPLETSETPVFLPKEHRKYFSNAIIAHHAGQTLAGIFLLRTFIEQYWLSLKYLASPGEKRITADELSDAYQQSLPADFKSRFPSLPALYGKLSAAMHNADASVQVFESTVSEISEHFEARKLFKLDAPSS